MCLCEAKIKNKKTKNKKEEQNVPCFKSYKRQRESSAKEIMKKFYLADEIIRNSGINKESAFEALCQDCFGEFLRIIANGTFYNGAFLHGGFSGNPVPYGDPEVAYDNLLVREDIDVYESGELMDTITVEKRLCDVIHW